MEHLPQECLCNILTRLSVKELSKCKCVCKSWLDIIISLHFITNHYLVYNNQQDHHLLVVRAPFLTTGLVALKPYISLFSWNTSQPKGLVSSQIFNPPYEYNNGNIQYWTRIMGPCNGIFCLIGYPNALMNPSMRQFLLLPKSHHRDSPDEMNDFNAHYGFGFDPNTNDYKIVVLRDFVLDDSDEGETNEFLPAELYSLNSNSWRDIGAPHYNPFPFNTWRSSSIYTFVRNCCHWWGFLVDESSNKGDYVLAFDMVSELFRKIKVPEVEYSLPDCSKTLVPFNEYETIGIIIYPRGLDEWFHFDVWVMKDYLDEGSWILQYSLGPVPVTYYLVGFYGSGQFVWIDDNERLVLYEVVNDNTRYLPVNNTKYDSVRTARYMESLVSLKRGNECSLQCFSCSFVPDTLQLN